MKEFKNLSNNNQNLKISIKDYFSRLRGKFSHVERSQYLEVLLSSSIPSSDLKLEKLYKELLIDVICDLYNCMSRKKISEKPSKFSNGLYRQDFWSDLNFSADFNATSSSILLACNDEMLKKMKVNAEDFSRDAIYSLSQLVKYICNNLSFRVAKFPSVYIKGSDNPMSFEEYYYFIMTSSLPILLKLFALGYFYENKFLTDLKIIHDMFELIGIYPSGLNNAKQKK